MPDRTIDYGRLVERALHRVVHDALAIAAADGLPGQHHLYITFRTGHPGVVIADDLRARHPTEMTIVLQHEFWDLRVEPAGFAVTLSFNQAPHRLEIPFDAVTVFADPSVEFGLQFTVAEGPARARPTAVASSQPPPEPPPQLPPKPPGELPEGGAEVVALDRFRKK
jgi:hypothetical protein